MSLTAALSSAVSGLSVAGRAAQTVSTNVANAMTPGYASRSLELSSGPNGGVRIDGITRRETAILLSDRRTAEAQASGLTVRQGALDRVADAIGRAEAPDSLSARVAALSARLTDAASQPSSDLRLQNAISAAQDLSGHLNDAGNVIQSERLRADQGIATAVTQLNEQLQRVDGLNRDIVRRAALGQDVSALYDQRRIAIDIVSDLVPVREIPRDGGKVSLITGGGTLLVSDRAAEVSFAPTLGMSATATLGAPLSGLMVEGREIDMARKGGGMDGGRLAALFDVRDSDLPDAQRQLDAIAHDLITRFENGVDLTLAAGAPGLFTDEGGSLGTPLPGLAQRIAVNTDADPKSGGALYRLRDGLGATAPGSTGNARLLQALAGALDKVAAPSDPAIGGVPASFGGLSDRILARATAEAFRLSTELGYSEAQAQTYRQAELAEGVDTDDEMRTLMLIEQSYAANARVIEAAGSMIDQLMEL